MHFWGPASMTCPLDGLLSRLGLYIVRHSKYIFRECRQRVFSYGNSTRLTCACLRTTVFALCHFPSPFLRNNLDQLQCQHNRIFGSGLCPKKPTSAPEERKSIQSPVGMQTDWTDFCIFSTYLHSRSWWSRYSVENLANFEKVQFAAIR